MNQKKSSKILIILIIIVLLVILTGGVIIICLATDLFKSDKELFFKYTTQIGDSENGFIDSNLKQYWEKQRTTPYINEGSFSTNITSEQDQQQFDKVNHFNISFSGQVDTANSKSAQDISLNYSDSVNFPISYRQVENKIGLQTKYVGNKFIAIETDKLANLTGSTDIDLEDYTDMVEKLQEMSKIELTNDEKSNIQNTYMEVLNTQLNEEKFTKVKDSDANGYQLSLTGEETKNLMIALLEKLKSDQTTLDKINEYLKTYKNSAKITVKDIENLIKSINDNSDFNDEKFEMTVYCQSGETTKILLKTNEMQITIQKENTKDTVKYTVFIEIPKEENNKVYFIAEYSGLSAIQSVEENYTLEFESEEIRCQYQFNNHVNFTDNVNIEDFITQNSMILTEYDKETVDNFLNAVIERISQVNKQQMEELGLEEDENPIIYAITMPTMIQLSNVLGESVINNDGMSEETIQSFNAKFEMYESTNLQGTTVKGLLSTIMSNNASEDSKIQIKEINFNGEEYDATDENITFLRNDVQTTNYYRVEFEKDQDTGAIYRAVINEK